VFIPPGLFPSVPSLRGNIFRSIVAPRTFRPVRCRSPLWTKIVRATLPCTLLYTSDALFSLCGTAKRLMSQIIPRPELRCGLEYTSFFLRIGVLNFPVFVPSPCLPCFPIVLCMNTGNGSVDPNDFGRELTFFYSSSFSYKQKHLVLPLTLFGLSDDV